jgi:hypothetical protein
MAAFGDVHRPKLSRPFIYIPEGVPMDRFQVGEIELSREGVVDQLRDPSVGSSCLEAFQVFRISETAQVLEDVCAGIELRVRILGRRAHRLRSLLRLESIPH